MVNVPNPLPLGPAEMVEEAWVAGIPSRSGRRAKWGGTLVLTDQRLMFEPLQVPTMAGDVPMGTLGTERRFACALSDLEYVEAVPESRALLRLHTRSGQTADLLIAAGRVTPLWSRKNTIARDAAVATINRATRRRPSPI